MERGSQKRERGGRANANAHEYARPASAHEYARLANAHEYPRAAHAVGAYAHVPMGLPKRSDSLAPGRDNPHAAADLHAHAFADADQYAGTAADLDALAYAHPAADLDAFAHARPAAD